jgi:hypothetical protein
VGIDVTFDVVVIVVVGGWSDGHGAGRDGVAPSD